MYDPSDRKAARERGQASRKLESVFGFLDGGSYFCLFIAYWNNREILYRRRRTHALVFRSVGLRCVLASHRDMSTRE
ncbi:hypothetical protein BP00DRAFT_63085 [Aspergillus indologenus CBS 114.80]|uniref:Uncharacterized protein n=1 Tax=Aspergillus indologenus CBS 114.80 TaxID=1450541 RepID=A0A2V5IQZ9_9EURO|nr:hypothetical protein BP00DRAFT_63085 [Aspergillus indologenus CBS 114.80]